MILISMTVSYDSKHECINLHVSNQMLDHLEMQVHLLLQTNNNTIAQSRILIFCNFLQYKSSCFYYEWKDHLQQQKLVLSHFHLWPVLLISISQEEQGDRLWSPLFLNDLLKANTAHDALGNTKLLPPLFQQGKQTIHTNTYRYVQKMNHTSD